MANLRRFVANESEDTSDVFHLSTVYELCAHLTVAFLSHTWNGIMMFGGRTRTLTRAASFSWDYMLVSEHVHGVACLVRGGFDLNSDHWPNDGSLRLERREL